MTTPSISFVSLGLVVLDEIRFSNQKPLIDVVGGSGAYATLGARLFLPSLSTRSLGWLLHIGNDFPESTAQYLTNKWDTTLIIDKETDKPSTRGLLEYKDTTFGRAGFLLTIPFSFSFHIIDKGTRTGANLTSVYPAKDFRYTTPILQVQTSSLKDTPLLESKAYHYLETPQNIINRVSDLLSAREHKAIPRRPLIIWEPAPPSCRAENLQPCLEAAHTVDVFSPNHLELAAFFGDPASSSSLDKEKIESLALRFLDSGVGPDGKGTVIIRAGEHGCFICARHLPPSWLPPFFKYGPRGERNIKVVDPTGAGNAFLGAYAIGYLNTGNIIEAACYGSVGASFVLEQVGMPEIGTDISGELWNGESVLSRLQEYRMAIGGFDTSTCT